MADPYKEWKGDKIASTAYASIFEGFPFPHYEVAAQNFSEEESKAQSLLTDMILGKVSAEEAEAKLSKLFSRGFMDRFREQVIKPLAYNDSLERLMKDDDYNAVKLSLITILQEFSKAKAAPALADSILSNSVGYGRLAPLIGDESLEEIMVNGHETSVFVFHRQYGHCRTNVSFSDKKELESILLKIARTVGKTLDADHPMVDARLPDGNRANATFSFVTPFGSTLTIRKFRSNPISIIDLIKTNTMSSELVAFLWVMVDGLNIEPMNIIVSGGTGSGKTTTLNALAAFIRFNDRIVSIEDTLELQFGSRQNIVQMEARPKFKGQEGVSMDDLLKNAMRMRPDRVIVGEVRGEETQTLFVAMDTGHKGIMGTLHSNSAKELILRLKAEPMSVPEAMIPLLNLILIQYRIYVKGKGIQRRVLSLTEVTSMENKPLLNTIYEWDRKLDSIKRTDVPMNVIDVLAEKTVRQKKDVEREIFVRKKILDWMLANNIHLQAEVEQVIQHYYYNPDAVLAKVLSDSSS